MSGCGFAPVYGNDGSARVLRNAVAIDVPDTIAGFRMRAHLEDRLGHASTPRFQLTATLTQDDEAATITVDGDTTRFNLVGSSTWALTPVGAAEPVAKGKVQTFTSYAATGSTVATQTAARDARDRLSVALADLIVARLILATADLTP